MSIEVRLPQLGESITHARLSVWLKQEGERVNRGEIIAEVETDKTSVEIEAPADGVLATIEIAAGTERVPVNAVLALLDDGTAAVSGTNGSSGVERAAAVDTYAASAEPTTPASPSVPIGRDPVPVPVPGSASAWQDEERVLASPLARRMAAAAGLALGTIRGTGPGGRITRADVDARLGGTAPVAAAPALAPARAEQPASAQSFVLPADDPTRYTLTPLSTMRRVTGNRLTQSKQQIPHFYLRIECAMDDVARARTEINGQRADKLSFTAFTLRAAALALRKVPAANAMWADGAVRIYNTVDLAVAVNTSSGLIAPVVRAAEQKSVVALNDEIRALAERGRLGTLKPEQYNGGTCTVSNLGMFGVTSLYPIINPPQTCILGLGAIEERPVVRSRAVAVGWMMTCTLAADHRALDGATGAEFLAAFRDFIQDPWSLLM
ncbi:MAG: dihydrolipoamide acetyltransferase family protein [Vicinamibacterales bacterium]